VNLAMQFELPYKTKSLDWDVKINWDNGNADEYSIKFYIWNLILIPIMKETLLTNFPWIFFWYHETTIAFNFTRVIRALVQALSV
jgi:hypothetical protein